MERTSPHSPNNGQEKKEKTLLDKAMDGTISSADFRSFIVDFIKGQNTDNIRTTECSLSKTQLDWNLGGNPCPVVDFNDQQNWVTDSIKIFNNSHKKVYFLIELLANPKFAIVFTPESGSISKNSSVDVTFKMHAFCTTKVYQMLRIAILNNKVSKNGTARKGFFTKRTEELGHLFVSFKVESELSSSLDFEEIKMGDQVAKGGYGTVYRAEWRTTEVAVKILNTQDLVEEERENVRREIRLMSKLNYSYIVTYMGSTQIKGQPLAIVMEFVKGGSLTDLLKKDISERFKCKLALDVAKGMSFLHSHNIYHRDIKPDNMLVVSSHSDAFVNLKITDFGTSRASTFSAVRATDPSYMAFNELSKNAASKEQRKMTKGIGTLIYQAPEIIRGETDYPIDKTDIYSMGVLMLEVFTRKEPFSEPPYDKWSKWEIEKFVASGKRVEIPSSVPSKIRALIAKCWAQVPTERSNFNEIVKVLTEVMELLPPDGPPSKGSGEKIPNVGSRGSFGSASFVMKSDIPIPNGDIQSIGWVGELERKDCEAKLKGAALGTFMLRWSRTTSSYVLTYQANTSIVHIAYIKPDSTGHITVDKEDGKKAHYDNIYDYIAAMKESNIITQPYIEPKAPSEDLYGKTPSLQKM